MLDLAAFEALLPQAKQRILTDEPMARHTTFQVGGPADVFFEPASVEEIRLAKAYAMKNDVPLTVLGNGSNVVVADRGIRGLVISLGNHFAASSVRGNRIEAQAGLQLARLSAIALQNGLGGLEFASGIPGTVGGAVMMNAGAYDHCMADVLVEVTCLTKSLDLLTLPAADLQLDYRSSIFSDGHDLAGSIILSMAVELPARPVEEIRREIIELGRRRSTSQPLEWPSAGSAFKRPPGHYAGRLIADCGLKGCRIGGAEVSEKHAGFVINAAEATASDVRRLFRRIQREVLARTGVCLCPEVRFIGDWADEERSDLPDRPISAHGGVL
jgi:UDP-N-acetylmuramate dehydrogenase